MRIEWRHAQSHAAHRASIHADRQLPASLGDVFQQLACDRIELGGYNPINGLRFLGWDPVPSGAIAYMAGSSEWWRELSVATLPISLFDHLKTSARLAGYRLLNVDVESQPIQFAAPLSPWPTTLKKWKIEGGGLCNEVELVGRLTPVQRAGIRAHLGVVCRQDLWMEGVRPPPLGECVEDDTRVFLLPVPIPAARLIEGLALAAQLWWADIRGVKLGVRR